MKTVYEKTFGGSDEGKAGIYVDGADLVQQARYPLVKIIQPATNALDKLLDKLEAAIPGSWDKPLIEKLKTEYKKELVELLAAKLPEQKEA